MSDVREWAEKVELREDDIRAMRRMDDAEVARVFDERIRTLEQQDRRSFVETGMICLEMDRRALWRHLVNPATSAPFHSLDAWMFAASGVSRSSAYAAMKAVREVAISLDDMREMPRCNITQLVGLSTAVQRDPDVIAGAKHGSAEEFSAQIRHSYPGQHKDKPVRLTFHLEESAKVLIDSCLEVVGWVYGVDGREARLECLATYFMDGNCEREGHVHERNADAYTLESAGVHS